MSIETNKLNIQFNIEAIKEDFAFIRFQRDNGKKWYGAKALDYLLGEEFKAFSVLFQYGKYAYAMFKKPIDVYQLLAKIRNNEHFDDNIALEAVPKAHLGNSSEECICEAWLAQILINSLSSSRSRFPKYHYCNLSGALLLVPDLSAKQSKEIDVAEIKINTNYSLEVKTVRYRTKISIITEIKKTSNNKRAKELKNALKKPEYMLELSTGSLRRILSLDEKDKKVDKKSVYIQCGVTGRKATRTFIDFESTDKFNKSRAGIIHNVMCSIKQHLDKYMTVDFCQRKDDQRIPLQTKTLDKHKKIQHILDGQKINIVDRVGNEDSQELVKTLQKLIDPYLSSEKIVTIGKRDKKEAFNLRIIHDKDYYEKREEKDEYLPSTHEYQRQNLTIESGNEFNEAILTTIIKELLIKRDIQSGKFSLFDWEKLNLQGMWTFASWNEEDNIIIFMEIQNNGNFKFRKIEPEDIFSYQEYNKYIELMTETRSGNSKKKQNLEGLIISNTGDINQIFCTDEITIPNLEEIATTLKEVELPFPENKRTGNSLEELVEEFIEQTSHSDTDKLNPFLDHLREIADNELDKKEFRKLLQKYKINKLGIVNKLRTYLLEKYQIRLIFSKATENIETLFDASLDIKYFGETDKEACYFVGSRKNVKRYFKDACHIRQIVAVEGKLIFQPLLQTMDVDFVRTGQSTVIPFPFKYIREYQKFDQS